MLLELLTFFKKYRLMHRNCLFRRC